MLKTIVIVVVTFVGSVVNAQQCNPFDPSGDLQARIGLGGGSFVGDVCVTPPASLGFCGSTEITAPADGELLIVDSGGTGVHWDMATAANRLILTDEADNANTIYLQVHAVYLDSTNAIIHPVYIWLYDSVGTSIRNNYAGGDMDVTTRLASGTVASGDVNIYSADQTNAGNYSSGSVNIHSGTTNTDGNTGDIDIYTGVAGAGAADAGSVNIGVHGTTPLVTVDGPTQAIGLLTLSQEDAPATCAVGEAIIDNGGTAIEFCYCQAVNTWRCTVLQVGPAD